MLSGRRFSGFGQSRILVLICVLGGVAGAVREPPVPAVAAEQKDTSGPARYRVFSLRQISAEKGQGYLAEAGIGTVSVLPSPRTLLVTAKSEDLIKATVILKLVDSEQDYVIEGIFPASEASSWPSNEKIEAEVGRISIGTFLEPPIGAAERRVIIDVHGEMVVAIAPAELVEQIVSAIERLREEPDSRVEPSQTDQQKEAGAVEIGQEAPVGEAVEVEVDSDELFSKLLRSLAEAEERGAKEVREAAEPVAEAARPAVKEPTEPAVGPEAGRAVRGRRRERGLRRERPVEEVVIEANEPEAVEVVEAAPNAWSYEPEQIDTGEEMLELDLPETLDIVALLDLVGKYLHLDYMYDPTKIKGEVTLKLQGPIKVKDLYPLLESVLKFKDFVMTRKGNLVTIVPSLEVLNIDPALLRTKEDKVKLGDVIVTRVFGLDYIAPASAKNLLINMKLGADISVIEETGTLIVTAYAYRMSRVEELLAMVDKPGTPKQFWFRQLQYTMAETLAPKLKTLADQLGTVSISIAARPTPTPPSRGRTPPKRRTPTPTPGAPGPGPSVYLDADERTNRILMIGYEDQLEVVEGLIDILDVAQQDLRALRLYDIQHVSAEEVRDKLVELGIIGAGTGRPGAPSPAAKRQPSKATAPAPTPGRITGEVLVEEPQVVIIESTNSLLVNATAEQHVQIATIIGYVDSETIAQAIPYEIYALENQKPEDLATVLQKLIHETVQDKEGKIQKTIKKIEEDIVIVPDENTFSLIVYASRKNQEWIGSLIKTLDRRRPQVLIDVTLVEITRSEAFDLDLQLVTKFADMAPAGSGMDKLGAVVTEFLPRRTVEVFSSPATGTGQGFYNDRHIQALLTAIQTKSYGRILAKPKILVNDGQTGTIQTTDTTSVKFEDIIRGGPDKDDQITVRFESYTAGITLTITPNISEGDLLLLEIELTRSDFLPTADTEKPPDTTETNIKTTVTVPDGRTIILGGLLKLNQTKGGTKVPLLGDMPLVGGLFRDTSNTDDESKLYVFVKSNILRPDETLAGLPELERISARSATEFEKSEEAFHRHENWPGIKPEPMDPLKVLEAE